MTKIDVTALYTSVAPRETDPLHFARLGVLPNPDRVLRRLGKTDEVFEDILCDAHVTSVVQSRKGVVLACEWGARPATERRSDRRAADLCRDVLSWLDAWDLIRLLLDGPLHGRTYMEVEWSTDGGMIVPAALTDRPRRRFVYDADGRLRVLTKSNAFEGEFVPDYKILEARQNPTTDNPYGTAALSSCFWPYTFKRGGWKYWVVFAEKYGMPLLIGKLRRGAGAAEQKAFDAALEQAVADGILRIPDGSTVETVSGHAASSTTVYASLTEAANAEISKAILGQTLTTEVREGSFAAAKVHNDVRADIANGDKKLVRSAMNRLFRWITEINVTDAKPPEFYFFEEETVPTTWVTFFKDAAAAKIPIPLSYVLKKTGIPAREGEEPMLGAVETEQNFAAADVDEPQDALDALVRSAVLAWSNEFEWWRRSMDTTLANAEQLPSDVSGWWSQFTGGEDTVGRVRFAARLNGMLAVSDQKDFGGTGFIFEALPFDEAIAFAKNRIPLTEAEWKKLADEDRAAAFTIAGVAKLDLLARLQAELDTALIEGTTAVEFRRSANRILMESGMDALHPHQAETIFRNNVQTAYAVGRHQQMTRPAMLARRPIWVYDAIDDDATRPTHKAMDQKAFRADDAIWQTWYPPNGHRCRCSVYSLSDREAERRGIKVESGREFLAKTHEVDGKPLNVVPDSGFASNPALAKFVPDLRKWPERLVRQPLREAMGQSSPDVAADVLSGFGAKPEHLGKTARGDGAVAERWASAKQRTEDAEKFAEAMNLNVDAAMEWQDGIIEEILRDPTDIHVYYYKNRGVQYLFRKSRAGKLQNVGIVYDPSEDRIQGVHDGYTDSHMNKNRNWSGLRKVRL